MEEEHHSSDILRDEVGINMNVEVVQGTKMENDGWSETVFGQSGESATCKDKSDEDEKALENGLDMDVLIKQEIDNLGVGSEEFFKHHEEIMEMIENSAKGVACNRNNNEEGEKK